jgi:type I restriction enzyme S subunit
MTMVAKRVTRLIADMAEGERESLTLAALRDALLPKLIFGEIRTKDVKKFMGGIV